MGPFDSEFRLDTIEDIRAKKKDEIVKRAKEIKQQWKTKAVSEGDTVLKDVHEGRSGKIESYGPSKLSCGSGIKTSDWIILVEGRADVLNLLRAGYDNSLAIEGARIDESIKEICSKKDHVVAFLDGDRAGGFILRELKSVVPIDYELRADHGVEVEELTPERIAEILDPVAKQIKEGNKPVELKDEKDKPLADVVAKVYPSLNETLEAVALDDKENQIFRVPISELVSKMSGHTGIKYLILDGIITPRLLEGSKKAGIEYLIGHRLARLSAKNGITLKVFADLGIT